MKKVKISLELTFEDDITDEKFTDEFYYIWIEDATNIPKNLFRQITLQEKAEIRKTEKVLKLVEE